MAQAPAPAAKPKMVRAVVALRRTVTTDEKHFGPGSVVMLAQDDHDRLAAAGFLAVPNAPPLPNGPGPAYDIMDGVQTIPSDGD